MARPAAPLLHWRLAGNDFSVAFSLTGYQPQTVPVRIAPSDFDPATGRSDARRGVVPDPVYVELTPAPPPPPPRRAATPPPKPKKPNAPPKQAAPAARSHRHGPRSGARSRLAATATEPLKEPPRFP